ncbi:MAG: hypothetical protein AAF614_07520 [Chloroflexota bacterium]
MTIDFLSRENLLGKPPTRRAKTQLFLIENRAVYWANRSWHHVEFARSDQSSSTRELAYLEAFALKREPDEAATIQDIEQFAPQWQGDIAQSGKVRAAIAHLLAEKYRFDEGDVPNIRLALGLDTVEVQTAFERFYKRPLATIYTPHDTLRTKLRWRLSGITRWLDSLSPFWLAFILTMTLGISSSVIALPSVVASVGTLVGLGMLFVMGLLNFLAVTSAVEATTNGQIETIEKGFFNHLVYDYLGRTGLLLRAITLGTASTLSLLGVFIGMATTLADLTAVPAIVWHPVFFILVVYLLWRGSVRLPIGLMVVVGSLQIGLFVLLALLAWQRADFSQLMQMPSFLLGERPFQLAQLGLPLGVIYLVYATQHKLIGQLSRAVLPREGGKQGLRHGVWLGSLCTLLLMAIWILTTTSALPQAQLAGYGGTVLGLMAGEWGGLTAVFCSLLLLLTLGLSASRDTFIVFNLVEERLPQTLSVTLSLPRRQGQVLFATVSEEAPLAKLTYLGIEATKPQFRLELLDRKQSTQFFSGLSWESGPQLANTTFSVVEATAQTAVVQLTTTMRLQYEGAWDASGVALGALAQEPEQQLIRWILQQREVTAQACAARWEQSVAQAQRRLDGLVAQGLLYGAEAETGEMRYRVRLQPRQGRRGNEKLWDALDFENGRSDTPHTQNEQVVAKSQQRQRWLQPSSRFGLALLPIIALFLLVEWLLVNNAQSFTKPFGIAGVLTAPIFAGILPLLMLLASRARLSNPSWRTRWLGHPLVVFLLGSVILGDILLHGLFVWQNPLEQGMALLVLAGVITAVWRMWRKGQFE